MLGGGHQLQDEQMLSMSATPHAKGIIVEKIRITSYFRNHDICLFFLTRRGTIPYNFAIQIGVLYQDNNSFTRGYSYV